jgi:lipoyl(octanoyl) transferase
LVLSSDSSSSGFKTLDRTLRIRQLGVVEYTPIWEAMQRFTNERDADTDDEIWLLEHKPVFTQGQAGKPEHLIATGDIPVVQADRGGQVTYHGPGQLVAYLLIDLKRNQIGVRDLVTLMEQEIVRLLADLNINAAPRADAPGVYIEPAATGAKIAQLGLRVRRGCSFHGLSLNVDMDMEPFQRINPCGYIGMDVTSIAQQRGDTPTVEVVGTQLAKQIAVQLGYNADHVLIDSNLPH